jgi:Cof subfamily protein (haloacid dehalogenase superfamily)
MTLTTPIHLTAIRDGPPPTRSQPRAPIRLIAIDLDGTLLRSDKTVSPRAIETIKAVKKRGVRVVLASARPPRGVRDIYHQLGLDTVQINYNGALIHDPHRRAHLYHHPLPRKITRQITRWARRIDPHVGVYAEILDQWHTDAPHDEPQIETAKTFPPDYVGPLHTFLHLPITKLMLIAPPARQKKIRQGLARLFSRKISVAISDNHLVQIIHRRVNKGRALSLIADHYGIHREHVVAIGDAPNDIEMLRWAGVGVAMANAWDQTRRAADVITLSNDEDGVAAILEDFVLRP